MSINKRQDHSSVATLNGQFRVSMDGSVSWTAKVSVSNGGAHPDTNPSGKWDLDSPTGSVSVAGGAARAVSAAAGALSGGLLLNANEALWYRLPLEASATVQANYIIVPVNATFDPDENWLMVVLRDDKNQFITAWGSTYVIGEKSGPKDAALLHAMRDAERNTDSSGLAFVAPGVGAGVVGINGWAFGFSGNIQLRSGAGNHASHGSSQEVSQASKTVGTPVYDSTGTAIAGRTWRNPVAGDRMGELGDLTRSRNGMDYATTTLIDLSATESLYYATDSSVGALDSGQWFITNPSSNGVGGSGFVVPSNWVLVAHRHNLHENMSVIGGSRIGPGEFSGYCETLSINASMIRSGLGTISHGVAMCAFTSSGFFTGSGDNGAYLLTNGNPIDSGVYVKWSKSIIAYVGHGETNGGYYGDGPGVPQSLSLQMPAAGTKIPLLGRPGITRVVDPLMGVPLAQWEWLLYIPSVSAWAQNSTNGGWVISDSVQPKNVPHNAVRVAYNIWDGSYPFNVNTAPPFASSNFAGSPNSVKVWFLGLYLVPGSAFGPPGQLDTIGTTESWRSVLYGAAANASNAGLLAVDGPGPYRPAYRIVGSPGERILRFKGFVGFSATAVGSSFNFARILFMPGVMLANNKVTQTFGYNGGAFSPTQFNHYTLDVSGAVIAGLTGVVITLGTGWNGNGPAADVTAAGWVSMQPLDGMSLD